MVSQALQQQDDHCPLVVNQELRSTVPMYDPSIVEYAKKLVHDKGMQKKSYIKDKIREITRFLI